jgi:1,4-alpha-glucan branching enzyme
MGDEFGQGREWNHDSSLDWHLLGIDRHAGVKDWVRDLNRFYREERALHELDVEPDGFEWIDCNDTEGSVLSLVRKGRDGRTLVLAVFNFTPVARTNYRLGVPRAGFWTERLNSDASTYGGGGWGNLGGVEAAPVPSHGRPQSLTLTLPGLAAVFFTSEAVGQGEPPA